MGKNTSLVIKWCLWTLIALGIGIHLMAAIYQPFFGDEILSLFFAKSYSYHRLISQAIEPIHPNTYYLVVKVLTEAGLSVEGLRLVQFGVFLASAFLIYRIFGLLNYHGKQRLIPVIFWVWSAYILRYSYLVRMYGLGILVTLISLALTLRLIKKPERFSQMISVMVDLLGIIIVGGYWLWVGIKYLSLGYLAWRLGLKSLRQFWAISGGILIAILLLTAPYVRIHQPEVVAGYLYWIPVPQLNDWVHMLAALWGMTSTYYLEGITPTPPNWGVSGGSVALLGLITLLYCWKKGKKIDNSGRFLTYLGWSTLGLFMLIFGFSYGFSLHVFHLRQLFPIGISMFVVIIHFALQGYQSRPRVGAILLVGLFILIARKTVDYASPKFEAYPQRYLSPPAETIYLTTADVELAFDQCQAQAYAEIETKCPAHQIYLYKPEALPTSYHLTTSAYHQLPPSDQASCRSLSVDFYECH